MYGNQLIEVNFPYTISGYGCVTVGWWTPQVIGVMVDMLNQVTSAAGEVGNSLQGVLRLLEEHCKFSDTAKVRGLSGREWEVCYVSGPLVNYMYQ